MRWALAVPSGNPDVGLASQGIAVLSQDTLGQGLVG